MPAANSATPKGPLAARWLSWSLDGRRAGSLTVARAVVENAGTATWQTRARSPASTPRTTGSTTGATRSSGTACALRCRTPSRPARRCELELAVRVPVPPGRYRFAIDLVDERRFWLAELGNTRPEEDVEIAPRIERRLAVVGADRCTTPDRAARGARGGRGDRLPGSRRRAGARLVDRVLLDAHQEGYGIVGGCDRRRRPAGCDPGCSRSARAPAPVACRVPFSQAAAAARRSSPVST